LKSRKATFFSEEALSEVPIVLLGGCSLNQFHCDIVAFYCLEIASQQNNAQEQLYNLQVSVHVSSAGQLKKVKFRYF
jgi:hypothetical protein